MPKPTFKRGVPVKFFCGNPPKFKKVDHVTPISHTWDQIWDDNDTVMNEKLDKLELEFERAKASVYDTEKVLDEISDEEERKFLELIEKTLYK